MSTYEAGIDGVTFDSSGCKLLGGFYKAAGETPRPTAILLHGLPGVEKNLDIAYGLRDLGWNSLYFHFRGSWGSEGVYSLAHLSGDTVAAVEFARKQQSVDGDRIALIGASAGFYPALLYAVVDSRIRAVAGVSPLLEPSVFEFSPAMADQFASMLNGITGAELRRQWASLSSLSNSIRALGNRPIIVVTGDQDEIFPPSHYMNSTRGLPNLQWIRRPEADHSFSNCRPWLVQTVVDFLVGKMGN